MNISLFLAKVIGFYFVILSLFIIIRFKALTVLMREIADNHAIIFLVSVITLILGLLLVVSHNLWVADWRITITIVAWLFLISGLLRLFFFDSVKAIGKWWVAHPSALITASFIYLFVGLFLLYIGFRNVID